MHSRGRGIPNTQQSGRPYATGVQNIRKALVVPHNPGWGSDSEETEIVKEKNPSKTNVSVPVVDETTKVLARESSGADFGDSVASTNATFRTGFGLTRGRGMMPKNLSSDNIAREATNSGNMFRGNTHGGGLSNTGGRGGQTEKLAPSFPTSFGGRGGRSRGNYPGNNRPTAHNNFSKFASSEPVQSGFGRNFGSNMNTGQGASSYNDPARGGYRGSGQRRGFRANQSHSTHNDRRKEDKKCFNCQGVGHESRDCTQPQRFDRTREGIYWRPYTDYGPSYLPKHRTVEQIFEEDIEASPDYRQIRILDDEVTISGAGSGSPPVVIENWSEADLHALLKANIGRARYVQPRKIQSYAIPLIIEGHDVNGVAETGSGKSAAFLIPIIDTIMKKKETGVMSSERSRPIALIIEPTREMAIQISEQAKKLAEGTGVSVAVAYGKYEKRENLSELSKGCDILAGTPGRLKDFITEGYVLPENLKFLVFDEADHLLEDQFLKDLRDIASVRGFPSKEERQTIFFSATCPEEIQLWLKEWMLPKHVFISNNERNTANHKIIQSFVQVSEADKMHVVREMLNEEKEAARKSSPNVENPPIRRTLVFMNTKRGCNLLASFLSVSGVESVIINGDQTQETRDKAVGYLRRNEVQVAVTTDVCARGIDIKNLDHVINVDMPRDYTTYIHRIGRTGRLKVGYATSCYNPLEDSSLADQLAKGVRDENQEVPAFLIDPYSTKPKIIDDGKSWGAERMAREEWE